MAELLYLVVYIQKDIFRGGFTAEVVTRATAVQELAERVFVQAGDAFDEGRRAAEIDIIIFLFLFQPFAQVAFFLLVLGKKVEVKAEPETPGEVGIRDGGVLVLHVDPGVVVPSLQGIHYIIGVFTDEGVGQADNVRAQENIVAVLFVKHPGRGVIGVGKVTGGCKDEGIAGMRVDAVIAAGVGSIGPGGRFVQDADIREDFGCELTFDTAVEALLRGCGWLSGGWNLPGGG